MQWVDDELEHVMRKSFDVYDGSKERFGCDQCVWYARQDGIYHQKSLFGENFEFVYGWEIENWYCDRGLAWDGVGPAWLPVCSSSWRDRKGYWTSERSPKVVSSRHSKQVLDEHKRPDGPDRVQRKRMTLGLRDSSRESQLRSESGGLCR
ncbi:hypothetical protein FRX31_008674, partial [Thalictrum thalictroides]